MKKESMIIAAVTVATVCICQIANADALLIDAYGGVDSTLLQNWIDAGVTEDISDGAGGTYTAGGGIFNISGMTGTALPGVGVSNKTGGPTAFGNTLLDDYIWTTSSKDVSIGGFDNTMTSSLGDMAGNTFTLQPNQDYKLYLFGAGGSDLENTKFTFGGVEKMTPSVAAGTGEGTRFVTYEFTTGADISGFTLDFSYDKDQTIAGVWNGAAIVAIPEPATIGLIGCFGGGVLFIRRRFMI